MSITATAFNGYAPAPLPEGEGLYGPDPYDYNFCIPVDFSRLENDRIALVPLIPRVHAPLWLEQANQDPTFEEWLTFRNETLEQLLQKLELARRNSSDIVLAIIDKGRPGQAPIVPDGSFAGIIGLTEHSTRHLSSEIAPVMVFKAFQRTYVTSSAVGLLLRYCLDVPAQGGLGLRRVFWTSNPMNVASVNAAKRMGFKPSGNARYESLCQRMADGRTRMPPCAGVSLPLIRFRTPRDTLA
ncbi:hypothetical protein PENSPDRAFT_653996 [Peniophora sp. CONT]|nr:hypothetical protein PENSPDRAFT_653996 [Peniophora sp. CONT]